MEWRRREAGRSREENNKTEGNIKKLTFSYELNFSHGERLRNVDSFMRKTRAVCILCALSNFGPNLPVKIT